MTTYHMHMHMCTLFAMTALRHLMLIQGSHAFVLYAGSLLTCNYKCLWYMVDL